MQMLMWGALAVIVGVVVALLIPWFPGTGSRQASNVHTLYDVLLIVSVPVFVLVETVVLYSVFKFRMKPGEEEKDGPPIHGNTRLEIIWTALPSILIAGLVVYAYLVLHDIEKAPADAKAERHVHVIAQQFAWQFQYRAPGGKLVTSDALYLPIDQSVKFDINSKDVLHDFWVPAFRMKIDTVPGITTHYRVTPNRLGNYQVVCAELCSSADFDAWLAKMAGGPAPSNAAGQTAAAQPDGKALFVKGNGTSTACASCHTLADAGATAKVGPDLDKAIASATPAQIRTDIVDPNAQIAPGFPKNVMPQDFSKTLSPAELTALVNYLDKVTTK